MSRARETRVSWNSAVLSGTIPDNVANGQEGRILEILVLIESSPACTMSDLALRFNLSESRLQHLFKQITGLGLGHVLTEKRLQTAASLLAHTNLRIKEIAGAVGYGHTSSFTRAFEQRFAQPPQAYRKAQAGGIRNC
jgi:transcriptional regulator GlxA family with amidase domain